MIQSIKTIKTKSNNPPVVPAVLMCRSEEQCEKGRVQGDVLGVEGRGTVRWAAGGRDEDLCPSGDRLLWALSSAAALSAPARDLAPGPGPDSSRSAAWTNPVLALETSRLSSGSPKTQSWTGSLCRRSMKPIVDLGLSTPTEEPVVSTVEPVVSTEEPVVNTVQPPPLQRNQWSGQYSPHYSFYNTTHLPPDHNTQHKPKTRGINDWLNKQPNEWAIDLPMQNV